jgi:hypothetical protein
MSTQTKQEYLRAICERYRRSSKKQKQTILDEFCQNCGYNRKYAIRLLRKTLSFVTPDVKRQLKDHLSTLDPFLLQQQISTKIKKILRLATPLQKITVANLPQNTYHPA